MEITKLLGLKGNIYFLLAFTSEEEGIGKTQVRGEQVTLLINITEADTYRN